MPVFKYKALRPNGQQVVGVKEADSPVMARQFISEENLTLLELTSLTEKQAEAVQAKKLIRPRYKASELSMVTKQLATLVQAGLPLARALEVLIDQLKESKFENIFRDVRERITQGETMADALGHHQRAFPPLYTSMIQAGEASGNLGQVLQQLSEYIRRNYIMRSKVINAFTYPIIMMTVGVMVVVFLLTFVVPKIANILQSANKVLPMPTQILITTSGFIRSYWYLILVGVVAGFFGLRYLYNTPRGRYVFDRIILKIPVFGELLRKSVISRFSLTFSTLLKSGIPALEALEIVSRVVDNKVVEEVLVDTRSRVLGGSDLATPLAESAVFPPLVSNMVAIGEQSGSLEEMLDKVGEHYNEEIEITTQRLLALLEPIMIIFLATIVGFIVLAIILPILNLSDIAR